MCKWRRRRRALEANEVLRFEFRTLLICNSEILTQKDIFLQLPFCWGDEMSVNINTETN